MNLMRWCQFYAVTGAKNRSCAARNCITHTIMIWGGNIRSVLGKPTRPAQGVFYSGVRGLPAGGFQRPRQQFHCYLWLNYFFIKTARNAGKNGLFLFGGSTAWVFDFCCLYNIVFVCRIYNYFEQYCRVCFKFDVGWKICLWIISARCTKFNYVSLCE